MRKNPLLNRVAIAAAILSPILVLTMKGGAGYCYFAVFTLSLVYLSHADSRQRAAQLYRAHPLFVWGMLTTPLIVLFQTLVLRTGTFPELDPLLRLALVPLSFFFLCSLPSRQLRLVQWGFVVGALAVGLWAVYARLYVPRWAAPLRLGNSFTNPIPFGDTALLLGFLALTSVERDVRLRVFEVVIKLAAVFAGLYASYVSGSRGGWIAIPLFVWVAASRRHWLVSLRARIAFGCMLITLAAVFASTSLVRERIEAIGSDVQQMNEGNLDTSMGLRLDLWRASAILYLHHPLIGVGRGSLESSLRTLADRGEAPRAIVNGRAHSEFFSALAETGTIGVAALILLYVGAILPFWRARRSDDPDIATAANMGIGLVGSTILFGLTIDVLTLVMNAAFFALSAATLLAWIEARKREIAEGGGSVALSGQR